MGLVLVRWGVLGEDDHDHFRALRPGFFISRLFSAEVFFFGRHGSILHALLKKELGMKEFHSIARSRGFVKSLLQKRRFSA